MELKFTFLSGEFVFSYSLVSFLTIFYQIVRFDQRNEVLEQQLKDYSLYYTEISHNQKSKKNIISRNLKDSNVF